MEAREEERVERRRASTSWRWITSIGATCPTVTPPLFSTADVQPWLLSTAQTVQYPICWVYNGLQLINW